MDETTLNNQNDNEQYTWIPAFKAIADWIVDYEDRQEELVNILIEVGVKGGLEDEYFKGEKTKLQEIDPFTFFASFLRFGNENRKIIIKNLLELIDKFTDTPKDFDGVPNPQRINSWLFGYKYERPDDAIPILWQLFYQTKENKIDEHIFNTALEIRGTGFTKLTQYLFYVNPSEYLPIDSQTEPWLAEHSIDIPKEDFKSYQKCLEDIKIKTNNKPFWEISNEAWLANQNNNDSNNKVESAQAVYRKPDSSVSKNMTTIPLNRILYGPPGTGKTYETTELAVQCVAPEWYAELINEYPEGGNYSVERREQLKSKYDELTDMGRIAFTTFHQSFAYEDFVEGIRPIVVDNEAGESLISYDVAEGVFKQLCDSAVATVTKGSTQTVNIEGKKIWKLSLGNTLTDTDDLYNECLENDYVLLGWGDDIDFTGCDNRKQVVSKIEKSHNISLADDKNNYKATAVNTFKNYMNVGDLIVVSDGNHKFRAIAEITGDYEFLEDDERYGYQQKRKVNWLRVYKPSLPISRLFDKSLSQMTIYQLKDTTINREKLKQLLSIESTIEDTKDLPYLLIIDEINRGNISRIFGELITLLEPDKRKDGSDAREVTLPYSKKKFSVPSNLYVLGTMNTADKSLAQLDLALRRRFEFIELLPNPSLLEGITVYGVEVSEILTTINARIEVLLDREHTIGHSYFWKLKDLQTDAEKESELANIFKKRIIPLLQEYFFSDWERIGWVLNDPKKNSDERFIQTENLLPKLSELFSDDIKGLVNDRRYQINENAFYNPQAYKKIMMSHAQSSESLVSQE